MAPFLVTDDSVLGRVIHPISCTFMGIGCGDRDGGGGGFSWWVMLIPSVLCCLSIAAIAMIMVIK